MVQDTRKDPRAKVLTMTVRYKSATIDEFIEHHSHDVSRGGIFIKTPSPFPPGTLLKFEIRIADDKSIIGGVGRVVWKRDSAQAAAERPSGMGVKFLKIDETSRRVIDQIVDDKGDIPSAFDDADKGEDTAEAPDDAGGPSDQVKPLRTHKGTMLGLGMAPAGFMAAADDQAGGEQHEGGTFFPKTDSEKDMPAPEERTVMKQAAELLAEALRGAGGSMDEIGSAPTQAKQDTQKDEPDEEPGLGTADTTPIPSDDRPAPLEEELKLERKEESTESSPPPPASGRIHAEPESELKPKPKPKSVSEKPARKPVQAKEPPREPSEEESEGGGMKIIVLLLAIVLVGGGVVYFTMFKRPAGVGDAPTATTEPTSPPTTATATTEAEAAAPLPEAADALDAAAKAEGAASAAPPATAVEPPPPPPERTATPKPPPPERTATPKPPPPERTATPKPPPPVRTATPKPPPAGDDNPY